MLQSYSFGTFNGYNELPDEILGLFLGLSRTPEKHIEFASEIISAGLQGRINFDKEFNLDAYETAIRKNTFLGQEKRKKREVFLDFQASSDDFDETSREGGLVAERFTPTVLQLQDAYEQVLLDDELEYAVSTIKELDSMLQVQEDVNILKAIEMALKGIPSAVDVIKKVCDDYEVVAEQIKIVLSSGKTFNELFAV